MTPDEVRMLDNREAILFIRGERPVMDEKYDLLKHPNVVYTVDGKGKPYKHGVATHAANTFELEGVYRTKGTKDEQKSEMAGEPAFQVLDEVTVEKMIKDGKWDRKKIVSE